MRLQRFKKRHWRWTATRPAGVTNIRRSGQAGPPPGTALFDFPPAIREVFGTTNACTTNTIESLNYSLCKVLKNRDAFPNNESIRNNLYLALQNAAKKRNRPIRDWMAARNQFVILFEE